LSLYFLTEHHATTESWASGILGPRILDLGTRWGEWSAKRIGHITPGN